MAALSTTSVAAVISGPIPSPASTRSRMRKPVRTYNRLAACMDRTATHALIHLDPCDPDRLGLYAKTPRGHTRGFHQQTQFFLALPMAFDPDMTAVPVDPMAGNPGCSLIRRLEPVAV